MGGLHQRYTALGDLGGLSERPLSGLQLNACLSGNNCFNHLPRVMTALCIVIRINNL